MSRVLGMLDTMRTEKEILEAIINGTVRIRRFNAQEQNGSSRDADRLLWLGILRAESELAAFECGKVCSGAPATLGGPTPPYRFLKSIAQPLPPSFGELAELLGHYEDRGQESIVCNSGDGFVNKLRPMRPSILSGYFAPLANIIYHNRIFPQDRYTLENIYFLGSKPSTYPKCGGYGWPLPCHSRLGGTRVICRLALMRQNGANNAKSRRQMQAA